MANPGTRKEAFPAFHFEVDIGGQVYPFKSCSGLKSMTKPFEVEEGGMNSFVHKLVGQTTFDPLVLRQGFCDAASPLYRLYLNFTASTMPDTGYDDGMQCTITKKRFDGFIRQIGPNGTSAKWVFKKAWITKWEGPDLDASPNEVSIESIEIVHSGLYLVGAGGSSAGGKDAGGHTKVGFTGGGLIGDLVKKGSGS